jgi:hypothetical protein
MKIDRFEPVVQCFALDDVRDLHVLANVDANPHYPRARIWLAVDAHLKTADGEDEELVVALTVEATDELIARLTAARDRVKAVL